MKPHIAGVLAVAAMVAGPAMAGCARPPGAAPSDSASRVVSPTTPPTYHVESSLGVQVTVPSDWQVNDWGCRSDGRPTLVRAPGTMPACLSVDGPSELAFIDPTGRKPAQTIGDGAAKLVEHPVRVDGVPARRAEGRISGGRYAGWVIIPSRHVQVSGRTDEQDTITRILDSVELVDIDYLGCPTPLPADRPAPSGLRTFVDPYPDSISVCYYGGERVLQASTQREGHAAWRLAAALNGTAPARDSFVAECLPGSFPTGYDAVLLVRSANGVVRRVMVYFQPCVPRRMDNGDGAHGLPLDLVAQIMDGMAIGYGTAGDASTPSTSAPGK
ncbi:MAG TPA: hypothetical protein VKB69_08950 [Micromonosporaceae bacterium]|nr:hypothetical protein [Micromonosporaceae bacterium]